MTTTRQARRSSTAASFRAAGSVTVQGALSVLLLPVLIVSAVLVVVWIGIPMLAGSLSLLRSLAMWQRRLAGRMLGIPVAPPYRPDGNGLVDRLRLRLSDSATYRDSAWLLLNVTIGFALGIVALVFYLVLPLAVLASPVMVRTYLTVSSFLLQRSDAESMAVRIDELAASRAETVDSQAAEIRRIERDLHDGAQARLVALSMNLGLAEQMMDKDPAMSRDLIAESRQSASVALTDLRGLVRGIHPPVLADRGLVGGLQALALAAPMEVDVDVQLPGRAPAPIESAVYFAAAEALTNAAKHGARTAQLRIHTEPDATENAKHGAGHDSGVVLVCSVADDGPGGADADHGTGLRGLGDRVAAVGGSLQIDSPPGRGTVLTSRIPVARLDRRSRPDQRDDR